MSFTEINRFTPLDRSSLSGEDAYTKYFKYMQTKLQMVIDAYGITSGEGMQDDVALLHSFSQKLLNSFECLRLKYLFDTEVKMKIDKSDSSFPNNIELMYLKNDAADRDEKLAQMRPRKLMLKDLVSYVYARRQQPIEIQHEIAQRTYFEHLQTPDQLFYLFTPGEITELDRSERSGMIAYTYTWGVFETGYNIPLIYQMIFTADIKYVESQKVRITETKEFQDILCQNSSDLRPLGQIASIIDQSFPSIYPKELKRFTIGPVYGSYSEDDEPISKCLRAMENPDAFALKIDRDVVRSKSETKASRQAAKSVFQNFDLSRVSKETISREVTEFTEFLFTDHAIGQKLLEDEEVKEIVKMYKIISL